MHIQSYQIQNVLNQCSRRLEKNSKNTSVQPQQPAPEDRIQISSDGRRQAILEKVVEGILDRIATLEPHQQRTDAPANDLSSRQTTGYDRSGRPAAGLLYNRIDGQNQKSTNRLATSEFSTILTQLQGQDEG